jgi:hypothetical protein
MMRTGLIWFGSVALIVGLLLIAANVALHFMGISASYNIGDPSRDEFLLISFWQIGTGLVVIGVGALLAGRRS